MLYLFFLVQFGFETLCSNSTNNTELYCAKRQKNYGPFAYFQSKCENVLQIDRTVYARYITFYMKIYFTSSETRCYVSEMYPNL